VVVDRLQPIDVEDRERELMVLFACVENLLVERSGEGAMVEEAGHRVEGRLTLEPVVEICHLDGLGHVGGDHLQHLLIGDGERRGLRILQVEHADAGAARLEGHRQLRAHQAVAGHHVLRVFEHVGNVLSRGVLRHPANDPLASGVDQRARRVRALPPSPETATRRLDS
jgi:hypothetical protein